MFKENPGSNPGEMMGRFGKGAETKEKKVTPETVKNDIRDFLQGGVVSTDTEEFNGRTQLIFLKNGVEHKIDLRLTSTNIYFMDFLVDGKKIMQYRLPEGQVRAEEIVKFLLTKCKPATGDHSGRAKQGEGN